MIFFKMLKIALILLNLYRYLYLRQHYRNLWPLVPYLLLKINHVDILSLLLYDFIHILLNKCLYRTLMENLFIFVVWEIFGKRISDLDIVKRNYQIRDFADFAEEKTLVDVDQLLAGLGIRAISLVSLILDLDFLRVIYWVNVDSGLRSLVF